MSRTSALTCLLTTCLLMSHAQAGPVRDWLQSHRASRASATSDGGQNDDSQVAAAPSTHADALGTPGRVLRDLSYGADPHQRFDVYLPLQADRAPVLFMVHGGAWAFGDKRNSQVTVNKVRHWLAQGFALVSVNYRLVPDASPYEQMRDVTLALTQAQRQAPQWGADPERFILMGHSAGAHLVGLLNANPSLALKAGARPWLGVVMLDSGAIDVPRIMNTPKHFGFYDRAFGRNPQDWIQASPMAQLTPEARPILAVCSSRRADSCPQARAFVAHANHLGIQAAALPQDLSHADINKQLGLEGAYTSAVDAFITALPGFKPAATP